MITPRPIEQPQRSPASTSRRRPRIAFTLRAGGPALATLAALAVGGCAHVPTLGTDARALPAFGALDLGPGFAAQVRVGEPFAVVVRGDTRFLRYVETHVEGDRLLVRMSDLVAVRPAAPMTVEVRLPVASRLAVAGSELAVTGLRGPVLALRATAGSRVRADGVSGERLALTIAGSSHLRITGEVVELRADISGASRVEARQLHARSVSLHVTPGARLDLVAPGAGAAIQNPS